MQIRNVRGDTSPLDFGQCNEVTYFISRPAHLRKISFAAAFPRVWPPRQNYNAPRPHIYKIVVMAEGRKEGRKEGGNWKQPWHFTSHSEINSLRHSLFSMGNHIFTLEMRGTMSGFKGFSLIGLWQNYQYARLVNVMYHQCQVNPLKVLPQFSTKHLNEIYDIYEDGISVSNPAKIT